MSLYMFAASLIEQALGYVDQGLSFISGLQPDWLQLIVYFAVVIFLLVGFFVFIKKFIKAFFVLAILGGGLYYLWAETTVLDFVKTFIDGLGAFITSIFILM